jgi:hypothetical protein
MSDETTPPQHYHTIRERIDAAEAAADEVVADESGQMSGEVNALAIPFEEAAAAVRAAINPDRLGDDRDVDRAAAHADEPAADDPETPVDTDQG